MAEAKRFSSTCESENVTKNTINQSDKRQANITNMIRFWQESSKHWDSTIFLLRMLTYSLCCAHNDIYNILSTALVYARFQHPCLFAYITASFLEIHIFKTGVSVYSVPWVLKLVFVCRKTWISSCFDKLLRGTYKL